MHSFKDTAGGDWQLRVNVPLMRRVKARTGVDLFALPKDGFKPLAALARDLCKFVDVLFVLVEDQAAAKKVSDEQFGEALGGDALEQAMNAFVLALADFFPAGQRQAMLKVFEAAALVSEKAAAAVLAELDALDVNKAADDYLSYLKRGGLPAAEGGAPGGEEQVRTSAPGRESVGN